MGLYLMLGALSFSESMLDQLRRTDGGNGARVDVDMVIVMEKREEAT